MSDGSEQPIAYSSRSLSVSECKFSQLEKEGLAIVVAIKKFHQFLHGRPFTIFSDHQQLKYFIWRIETGSNPCIRSHSMMGIAPQFVPIQDPIPSWKATGKCRCFKPTPPSRITWVCSTPRRSDVSSESSKRNSCNLCYDKVMDWARSRNFQS